jgi:hypothetical protein
MHCCLQITRTGFKPKQFILFFLAYMIKQFHSHENFPTSSPLFQYIHSEIFSYRIQLQLCEHCSLAIYVMQHTLKNNFEKDFRANTSLGLTLHCLDIFFSIMKTINTGNETWETKFKLKVNVKFKVALDKRIWFYHVTHLQYLPRIALFIA